MPKLRDPNARPPGARNALAEELRRIYGGALTLTDLMDFLGYKDPNCVRRWLKEEKLEAIELNGGRKKWLAIDIARAIDNSKIRTTIA